MPLFKLQEPLLEIGQGNYFDREHVYTDEYGEETSPPADFRYVVRWLGGKMLFVAKASIWNGDQRTYDGRHSHMSATDIRNAIERSIGLVESNIT